MHEAHDSFPRILAPGLRVLGNYYFNLYLVQGEQASALIEVGVSGVVDEVIRQLDALGVAPSFLVVTHPHSDHVTGLAGLKERFPLALVVAGEGAAAFLAHPKARDALVVEDRHMTKFLETAGLIPGRPPVEEPPSLTHCMVAKDGDEMDLGGITLRFLSVAGHSPGKIVVYIPEIRALILSDSLGFRYPGRGVFPLFLTDYAEYLSTLDRLQELDAAIVGVAHQGPLVGDEVRDAFAEARTRAEELHRRLITDSKPPEELIEEIFKEFYRDELTVYTPENIRNCARLVLKRARS